VLASDVDTDDDANSLTYAISNGPAEGSASSNGDGTFTFDPGTDFQDLADGATRTVSFDVAATDSSSAASNTSTVNVTVTGVNDAPVITQGDGALSVTMSEDGSPTAFVAPTLGATDIDGVSFTWSISSAASNGTADVSGTGASPTTFTYSPAANFNGTDSFTIEVADGNGGTDSITVNVSIDQVNDPAVFSGDLSGQGIDITGTLIATDPADGMTTPNFTVFAQSSLGTATVDAVTGDWTFTPNNPLVLGDDSFTVQVTDDDGNQETQVISLEVIPVYVDADGNLVAIGSGTPDRIVFSAAGSGQVITRLNNVFYGPNSVSGRIIAYGNAGNDRISVNTCTETEIHGGTGNDQIRGGSCNDTVFGEEGRDVILLGSGDNWADGGGGNDLITARGGSDTIRGGGGNDSLYGGPGRDYLYGDIGNDRMNGGGGSDLLVGGLGNDRIWAGAGADVILGGRGNDDLRGATGNDLIVGGTGNDHLHGERGRDLIHGGTTSLEDDALAQQDALLNWAISDLASDLGSYDDDDISDGLNGGGGIDQILVGVDDVENSRNNDIVTTL